MRAEGKGGEVVEMWREKGKSFASCVSTKGGGMVMTQDGKHRDGVVSMRKEFFCLFFKDRFADEGGGVSSNKGVVYRPGRANGQWLVVVGERMMEECGRRRAIEVECRSVHTCISP